MSTSARLALDARQLAMLEEMHIKLWLPPLNAEATDKVPATVPVSDIAAAGSSAPLRSSPVPASVVPAPVAVQPDAPAGNATGPIAQMDWATLQQAVEMCRSCKLCESRTHTVFGTGQRPATPHEAPQADWLIVGEAPGEQEDLTGEPFVGPSGQLLDNMLKAIGLARQHQVFITNVLKCRPPANRNPQPGEMVQCAPFLQRQIDLLRPRIILAMGRFAAQALLQTTEPIGKLRGRIHQYHGVPVVVSYHPAYLLRNLPEKAKAWEDLCLAVKTMRG